MKVVVISDTHLRHTSVNIPTCDLLVHAGDFSNRGNWNDINEFIYWMKAQPTKHRLLVPGNHDLVCENEFLAVRDHFKQSGILFERENLVFVDNLMVFCYSDTPEIYSGSPWAFTYPRESEHFRRSWENAPVCDLLVTHGPPLGVLDEVDNGLRVGEKHMMDYVLRSRPKAHVFGHIHESFGYSFKFGVNFYNASICDLSYKVVNPPTVFEL